MNTHGLPHETSRNALSTRAPAVILALCLTGPLAGCSSGAPAVESVERTSEELNILTSALWHQPTIRVCWDNPTSSDSTQRGWVQEQVAATWSFVANVSFVYWATCNLPIPPHEPPPPSPDIRITIVDETSPPATAFLGRFDRDIENGVKLNFTFVNWNTDCQNTKESCIRAVAAHEFGHVLGFAHEANRPDTPASCDMRQGTDGDATFGSWDLSSIMNYCNPAWNNDGHLSSTDTSGMQRYYGVGPRYLAATQTNLALL